MGLEAIIATFMIGLQTIKISPHLLLVPLWREILAEIVSLRYSRQVFPYQLTLSCSVKRVVHKWVR